MQHSQPGTRVGSVFSSTVEKLGCRGVLNVCSTTARAVQAYTARSKTQSAAKSCAAKSCSSCTHAVLDATSPTRTLLLIPGNSSSNPLLEKWVLERLWDISALAYAYATEELAQEVLKRPSPRSPRLSML